MDSFETDNSRKLRIPADHDRQTRAELRPVSNEQIVEMFVEELWVARAVDELERLAKL